jgi:hypothetical protein
MTVTTKPDHREERAISRKPLRAGMPGYSGEPRGDYTHMLSIFAYEAAGASSARHSPRPLISDGFTHSKTRADDAARSRRCVWEYRDAMTTPRNFSPSWPGLSWLVPTMTSGDERCVGWGPLSQSASSHRATRPPLRLQPTQERASLVSTPPLKRGGTKKEPRSSRSSPGDETEGWCPE